MSGVWVPISQHRTHGCLVFFNSLGARGCLGGIVARFADVSLIGVPFLVGTCLRRGTKIMLTGKAIKRHATEDNLCWEAFLRVVFAISKAGDGASLGVLDLAQHLSLLHLLHFKFLTAFLVSGLLVIGTTLLALSRPRKGSIEFDNGNSARIERGPIVKTIWAFLFAESFPCLTTMVMGSSLKSMVTWGAIFLRENTQNKSKQKTKKRQSKKY